MRKRTLLFSLLILTFGIVVSACDSGPSSEDDSNDQEDIPETTNIFSAGTTDLLAEQVGPETTTFIFTSGTDELDALEDGDVIVGGASAKAPAGFLRRVTDVQRSGGQVRLETTSATLTDAVNRADINVSRTLTTEMIRDQQTFVPGVRLSRATDATASQITIGLDGAVLYDRDGDPGTPEDQIRLSGQVGLDPEIDFSLSIENGAVERLDYSNQLTVSSDVTLSATATLAGLDAEVVLSRFTLQPIVVTAGPVPIVIVPELVFKVDGSGRLQAGLSAGISREDELRAAITYDGAWDFERDAENTNSVGTPEIGLSESGVVAEFSTGPDLSLKFYGVAGPFLNAGAFAGLEVSPLSNPWWTVEGGIQGQIGARVDILGNTLREFSSTISIPLFNASADGPLETPGIISGRVADAATGTGIGSVQINARTDAGSVAETTTNADGQYEFNVSPGEYEVQFSKSGYLPETYSDVIVEASNESILEPVLQVDEAYSGNGSVSGVLLDALTSQPVAGLEVTLREGINATQGDVVATAGTDQNGEYNFPSLAAGNYTAVASGNGYADATFTITCLGGQSTQAPDASISPTGEAGEYRFVLSWGESPSDLDAHLTGPKPGSDDRFHVYYGNRTYNDVADLDTDDISSYGPETITVDPTTAGVYRYSVHNYSDRLSTSSSSLASSSAQVEVYDEDGLLRTFNVPSEEGTLWTVFELEDGEIRVVNSLLYESNPSNDDHFLRLDGSDAQKILNLPVK